MENISVNTFVREINGTKFEAFVNGIHSAFKAFLNISNARTSIDNTYLIIDNEDGSNIFVDLREIKEITRHKNSYSINNA